MATLTAAQAAGLLKHRCRLVSFEHDIDEGALLAGAPCACLPILRYMFVNFSAPLNSFLQDEAGHTFHENMSDAQLIAGIMCVWDVLAPNKPLGAITVAKVLQPRVHGIDRLHFTLECVGVCACLLYTSPSPRDS